VYIIVSKPFIFCVCLLDIFVLLIVIVISQHFRSSGAFQSWFRTIKIVLSTNRHPRQYSYASLSGNRPCQRLIVPCKDARQHKRAQQAYYHRSSSLSLGKRIASFLLSVVPGSKVVPGVTLLEGRRARTLRYSNRTLSWSFAYRVDSIGVTYSGP
jgi:hypothetical protein